MNDMKRNKKAGTREREGGMMVIAKVKVLTRRKRREKIKGRVR